MSQMVPISREQWRVHVATETLALATVPLLWRAAADPVLTRNERVLIRGLAVGTLLVDGWLLWQNLKRGAR